MSSSRLNYELQQQFCTWFESTQMDGRGGRDLETEYPYVPQLRVTERFETSGIISQLLYNINPDQDLRAHHDTIVSHYRNVFSILILIGQGHHIRKFVHHSNLRDNCLPFIHKPPNFPFADIPNFFERFNEVQWKFCVEQLCYNMDSIYEDARILPIRTKVRIATGGSCHVFKITIGKEHDQLKPPATSGWKSNQHSNTYVLKTYRTVDAQRNYDNEVNAFRTILTTASTHGEAPVAGLIGFYGNFTHCGTHNILLEFADAGTLEQYFCKYLKPKTEADILSLWDKLFNLIFALKIIHNAEDRFSATLDNFRGWHQDIKPSNILVVSSRGSSPYQYDFKLADFGLSHFRKPMSKTGKATDTDTYGTRTYGAPEVCRYDPLSGPESLQITQSVDIWSLGCIYSEAATWIVFGEDGLKEYRASRQAEISRKSDFDDGDCFHNGYTMLTAVRRTHQKIEETQHPNNNITKEVLKSIVIRMLAPEKERAPAWELRNHSTDFLNRKRDARKSSMWISSGESIPDAESPSRSGSLSNRPRSNHDVLILENQADTKEFWSVSDAILWKDECKKRWLGPGALPEDGENYMKQIDKRDHVFILDDSNSMRATFWSEMTVRFSLLAYIVKGADPDGLDLYFSSSTEGTHSYKSSDLAAVVKKRLNQPVGSENLSTVLKYVFENFYAPKSQAFFSRKKRKPTTCYILTDGTWCLDTSCNVEAVIRESVKRLRKDNSPENYFGIQFISFGSSQEGLEHLRRLDSGLQIERDIVDTESANGNVWKMLLGSINKYFDGDS